MISFLLAAISSRLDSGEITGVHEAHKNPITLSAFIANNTIPPGSLVYGNPLLDYSNSTAVTVSLFIPRSRPDTQIAEAENLSEIATKNILDSSIEFCIVDFYGSGRGRTYILSPKVYNTKSKKIGYVRQVDIDETRYPELIINMAKTNEYISRADVIPNIFILEIIRLTLI